MLGLLSELLEQTQDRLPGQSNIFHAYAHTFVFSQVFTDEILFSLRADCHKNSALQTALVRCLVPGYHIIFDKLYATIRRFYPSIAA